MSIKALAAAILHIVVMASPGVAAADADLEQIAKAFGARQSIEDLAMSPDGETVAYLAPGKGQGAALYAYDLKSGGAAKPVISLSGAPERISDCSWVSNDRLACHIYAVVETPSSAGVMYKSRLIAVNADGTNLKTLSNKENANSQAQLLYGGGIIDWLPDEDGNVLMTRHYVPDDHVGTRLGSKKQGLGVDRIDTRTGLATSVEPPRADANDYISDGRGNVRIMGQSATRSYRDTGVTQYSFRLRDEREWKPLSEYDSATRTGFLPEAIDPERNLVYGFKKLDGRLALHAVSLDGSLSEKLVYAHPEVDVDRLIRIGKRRHVVGASYATDIRHAVYVAADVEQLMNSLSKALAGQLLRVVDSSADENRMLVFASSDADSGAYYIFDRKARQLKAFLVARDELEGRKLASVKPIQYPADDGTLIPAYLTLPPGRKDAKGLPAIVLPHGGPSYRDEWGFDWLPQFFAARGFVVLQPNFRGSSGYGDTWFREKGFKSWPVAIGDVLSAGRWLVSQGLADPDQLGIVGWSYGGYAALQSAVVDPKVFKAVVAIAPVTDLAALKEEHRHWSDFALVSDFVGSGPHVEAGSPIEHVDRIQVPVLLFHGASDFTVDVRQSTRMAKKLKSVGGKCELVTWGELDHYLEDSSARTEMLRTTDEFLRKAFAAVDRP